MLEKATQVGDFPQGKGEVRQLSNRVPGRTLAPRSWECWQVSEAVVMEERALDRARKIPASTWCEPLLLHGQVPYLDPGANSLSDACN
jgi:hypothetical protein